ncbi:hypothetical protein BU16DRAFT_621729 [Lophium mytilinum]|uniref:Uncharacterized protein n=1 Tax=Lophium mytilinum TaxID=390894 RepID=A0A6A6QGE9_9PEZI|nr:hypothetical protein BU16DRAFT_621729 [Lophium mytilinum]
MGDVSFKVDPQEATRSLIGVEGYLNFRRHIRNAQHGQTVKPAGQPLDAMQQHDQSGQQGFGSDPPFRYHAYQAERLLPHGPLDQHPRSTQQQHDPIQDPMNRNPLAQQHFVQMHEPLQQSARQSLDSAHRVTPPPPQRFGQIYQPPPQQTYQQSIRHPLEDPYQASTPTEYRFGQLNQPSQTTRQHLDQMRPSPDSSDRPVVPAQQHFSRLHQPLQTALNPLNWMRQSSNSTHQPTPSAQQHVDTTYQPAPTSAFQQLNEPAHSATATLSTDQAHSLQSTQTVEPLQPLRHIQHEVPKAAVSKKRKRSEPKDTQDPNPRPTKLRVSNPVRTPVSACIWNNVFKWSHPNTLLTCRDMQFFMPLLANHTAVWRDSRVNTYGNEIPDPLPGLSEEQYANLLSNRKGCQVTGCEDKLARKTYWAFCKRLCQAHMSTELVVQQDALNTIKQRLGQAHVALAPEVLKCVPSGTKDSWKNYTKAGPATERFSTSIFHTTELNNAINEFLTTFPDLNAASADEKRQYLEEKQRLATERVEFALKIEKFEKEEARRVRNENARLKTERKEEFFQKAAEMVPPMAPEVLVLCPSYKKSLDIAKAPTPQSWAYLLEKLGRERAEAEAKHARNVQNMLMM